MAGTVKKLQFSEGTDVGAPSDLGILSSTTAMSVYASDAAFVTANGTAQEGDMYINSTDRTVHLYVGTAWRSIPPKNDFTDATKIFAASVSGNTTGKTSTLSFSDTVDSTHTIPAGTNTLATNATATSTVAGLTTSFAPLIVSGVNAVSSADYTGLTADGYHTILFTTGASDRTYNYPAAASNAGRIITIAKVDSGTGKVTLDPNSSETINGLTTITLYDQNDCLTAVCNGSAWYVLNTRFRDWHTFTLTGALSTNTTYTAAKRRVGGSIEIRGKVDFSGATNSASATFTLPSSFTIDSTNMENLADGFNLLGQALMNDSSTRYEGRIAYATSTTVRIIHFDNAGNFEAATDTSNTSPFTVGSGDYYTFWFSVPVTQYRLG